MRESRREAGAEKGAAAPAAGPVTPVTIGGRLRRMLRRATTPSRGFILVLVVGALSVLTVLGLSYTEQSRADLLGASNGRDLLAADGLAETGFQMGLRILADDRNVWSTSSVAWNMAQDGVGHTSRWGYNTNYDLPVNADQDAAMPTPSGVQPTPLPAGQLMGTAFNRRIVKNYLDSWQTMIWNEEPFNNNLGYAYSFKFDPSAAAGGYKPSKTYYNQRRPADERIMLDTWALQPLARTKRFKVQTGLSYGVVQISISPRDGAINVNDVFDPGTNRERWGFHDWNYFNGTVSTDPLASPDRRTLDYILGRRPEYATQHAEYCSYDGTGKRFAAATDPGPTYVSDSLYDKYRHVANEPCGSIFTDNGVYNFRGIAEPNGRTYATPAGWPLANPKAPIAPSSSCYGRLTKINSVEPLIFYNANLITYYRYNFEAPRYPCYVAMAGPSMRYDGGSSTWLTRSGSGTFTDTAWWPTGRGWRTPAWNGSDIVIGPNGPTYGMNADCLFQGMGFDLINQSRGGVGVTTSNDPKLTTFDDALPKPRVVYNGAGMYGHPVPHSFQHHPIAAVQGGKFWTDLQANWYFGGSPGYTNKLGRWPDEVQTDQWAFLGSSYDSMGIGTQWMPPTCHVWMPGFYNGNGTLDPYEVSCGLLTSPRNMPPAKPAATFTHPLNKWADDMGMGSPHFAYGNQRNMIRAFGLQENWGPPGSGNPDNRMYDAVNINVAPYEVVYGLLTPEKFPSMLNRTVVAPHLHWKSRYFDGAYDKMETFARYTPTGDPMKLSAHFPNFYPDAPYMPITSSGLVTDGLPPAVLTAGSLLVTTPINLGVGPGPAFKPNQMPYRFGSVDYNGYFEEFKVDDTLPIPTVTTPTNIAQMSLPAAGQPAPKAPRNTITTPPKSPYYCVMGPAPFNFSIHKHYEPLDMADWVYKKQATWYPQQVNPPAAYPMNYYQPNAGYRNNVGMVLNRMDFRTPEPAQYFKIRQSAARPGKLNPDPADKDDFDLFPYKSGTGEPAEDVFVDCHYDLSLSPNIMNASDPNVNSVMMCRKVHVSDWTDWFAQRKCTIDLLYGDSTHPYAPTYPSGQYSNTVTAIDKTSGIDYSYPDGRNFSFLDENDGSLCRKNPVAKPHPLYGVPNPDYMLQYPGTFPSYYWSDQFRRYFPVEGGPPDFSPADPAATPPKPDGIGLLAQGKDKDVQDFSLYAAKDTYSMPPAPYLKLVDDVANLRMPFVQPNVSVPKGDFPILKAPFVPGISKDDAWRITRIGRKYQEIIADEIMDYQVNPWWPNASVHFTEMAVPMDLNVYPADFRPKGWLETAVAGFSGAFAGLNVLNDAPKSQGSISWGAYHTYQDQDGIEEQVPDYYAYFNRFWIRTAHTYARNTPTAFGYGPGQRNNDYRCGIPYGAANLVEARGKYPQTYQYWGGFYNSKNALDLVWQDNIRDFPENTLEDQLGGEFRYITAAAKPMFELPPASPGLPNYSAAYPPILVPSAQMSAAPGRNHPFKNWADFVAMLGHLVYRSPMTVIHPAQAWDARDVPVEDGVVTTNRQQRIKWGIRDRILGVDAWEVCHGNYADPRNKGQFFDGSQIAAGKGQPALADALQGYYGYNFGTDTLVVGMGGRNASEAIVAIDGFWPISGNLGVFHDPLGKVVGGSPPEALLYPARPAGHFADNTGNPDPDFEWKRRIDEWRGCDASGLRIEQQYISERAANDILVSLSNGQIGPIDFDGDGHITMTRAAEIPNANGASQVPTETAKGFWPLYPYNKSSGLSIVEYHKPDYVAGPFGWGVFDHPSDKAHWRQADKSEHITNCVTLPIKFRSNTFRVTVAVELTDSKFRNTAAVHKYSRVYSRVVGPPAGNSKVHGPYTGEFILHGNRAIDGVDPEGSWLGTDFGSE